MTCRGDAVIYYATHSTTARNDAAQAAAGIGLILGPDQLDRVGRLSVPTWGRRYALDNGAWSAFTTGRTFDGTRFWSLLERLGDTFNPRARFVGSCQRPDWIVCPDIVAGGMDSLRLSLDWLPYVAQYGHPLIAVQDGMTPDAVAPYVDARCGIFVGGSTDDSPGGGWKWRTLPTWASLARELGAYLHVGRVNSVSGIKWCAAHGVNSCDGTSATKWAVNAPRLGAACRGPVQMALGAANKIAPAQK